MKLHENLQLWLDIFVDKIPKESVINQLEEFQELLDIEKEKVIELGCIIENLKIALEIATLELKVKAQK